VRRRRARAGRRQPIDAAGDDRTRHGLRVERAPQALRGERAAAAQRLRVLCLQAIECGVGAPQAPAQAEQSKVSDHDVLRSVARLPVQTPAERRGPAVQRRLYARNATAA
jgi:hypothetical protein